MTYNAKIVAIPMPQRIKRLPVSVTGFPVPWFVAWVNSEPDFRVIGPGNIAEAWKRKKCWVCGEPLGVNLAMTLGPMCTINRTISEPPAHRDCAVYSALACPFLSNPRTKRNENELPANKVDAAGFGIRRNPGAVAVWITREVRPFNANNGVLFTFGEPSEVLWFAEGRAATRQEVSASIASGLPILFASAKKEGPEALEALKAAIFRAGQYLPAWPVQHAQKKEELT